MNDENLDRSGKDMQRTAEIERLRFQLEQTESALLAAQQDAKAAWGAARACDKEIARLRSLNDLTEDKCGTCSNWGRIMGLSQDSYCAHCRRQSATLPDLYEPKEPQK